MNSTSFRLPALAAILVAGASAQGADDCTAPQTIAGAGPFTFDTSIATTDGMPDFLCDFFGNDDIFDDVWFQWTATEDGPHILSLCGGNTTGDTKVAVYDGSCAGSVIACNDDSCGLISELTFDAVNGSTYAFRVGNFAAGGASIGDFTVMIDAPIQNPNNGHFYRVISEQLSWNDAKLAAEGLIWQGFPGHLVTIEDQIELDWILNNLNPQRPWIGLSQNVNAPGYAEPDGGWEWVTGEPFNFTNWAAGEPSNNSASGGSEEYIEMFGNGQWNDAEDAHIFTTQYLVEWDGTGTLGTNYCMAEVNSTGNPADISAAGSLTVADNDLTLSSTNLPPLSFGFYIVSRLEGFVPNPGGSSGNICLSGAVGRYVGPGQVQNSGSAGQIDLAIDLTQIPQPTGFEAVISGDTWHFQLWHRDSTTGGMPTSNFTNGVRLVFN
ncbi:MAG: C-type lectin domain-containing protein [Planctomycetota bacterium]